MAPGLGGTGHHWVNEYGFAANEVFMTARGGYRRIRIIGGFQDLRNYTHLRVRPIESGIGDNVSPELLKYLDMEIIKEVHKIEFERHGGKALLVKGKIIHLFRGYLEKYIVAKVEFLDADTRKSFGVANIEGKSEGIGSMGMAAEGVAIGIAKLLETHGET